MQLATKFTAGHTMLRSDVPLTFEQMRTVAPSIFAEEPHASRSDRYAYIPTSEVLRRLQLEGFSPFLACQSRSRDAARREHTKHMVRLRHASQITGEEANEIILINSHDGTSAYQMLAGVFRFVCGNGMVCGTTMSDVRVRHNGNVIDNVIEGAFSVVKDFETVDAQKVAMKGLWLTHGDQVAFARAARALKYDDPDVAPPVTEHQLLHIERPEDNAADLWTTFNRVQEHLVRGGIRGRRFDGRRATTRPITAIDQNVKINRALWILAEAMRELKGS
ncbi:MAG: DUF932 domain-containing protein [Pseudomonadota bacterium]